MEIVRDDCYEEMSATYQCLEIANLNEILKKNGITDKALRQKICSEAAFSSGVFLDSGWLTAENKRVYPELCFAERPLDPEEGLGEIVVLYVPSTYFSFHEYAGSNISWYFEENNEEVCTIEHGVPLNYEGLFVGAAHIPHFAVKTNLIVREKDRGLFAGKIQCQLSISNVNKF